MNPSTTPSDTARKRLPRRAVVAICVPLGLAIGFGVVGGALAAGGPPEAEPTATATPTASANVTLVHINDVTPGICLAEAADTLNPPKNVSKVACTDAHPIEVIGVHVFTEQEYPGAREVGDVGFLECAYARDDLPPSPKIGQDALNVYAWPPGKESWEAGDRTLICYAALKEEGAQLTGSLTDGTANIAGRSA